MLLKKLERIQAFATHGNQKVCYASEKTSTATTPSVISSFTVRLEAIGLSGFECRSGSKSKSTAGLKE